MGTDIHGVWQRKTANGWDDIESIYDQNRDYQLFAILAGVRNGFGFAGVHTGDAVIPIASPRGLPADFSLKPETSNIHIIKSKTFFPPWRQESKKQESEEQEFELWMGDHSFSWLTGKEILTWFETAPMVTHCGVISRKEYETWDRTEPMQYFGDIYGNHVKVIDESEVNSEEDWTHVKVEWKVPLNEEMSYFTDEVRRLVKLYGEIRFVFGFDS